jgi:hypothetical protein
MPGKPFSPGRPGYKLRPKKLNNIHYTLINDFLKLSYLVVPVDQKSQGSPVKVECKKTIFSSNNCKLTGRPKIDNISV